jgi:hypothetical protein
MKPLLLVVSLCALSALTVQAQQAKSNNNAALYSYKCHLALADKREVIRDYRRQPRNQNRNLERMLQSEQVAVEKGQRLAIAQVFECVERDAEFSKAKARELDRVTLR